MLINLSIDEEVLNNLVQDDAFLETLLNKMMVNGFGFVPIRRLTRADAVQESKRTKC